jgi:hypothetical protein
MKTCRISVAAAAAAAAASINSSHKNPQQEEEEESLLFYQQCSLNPVRSVVITTEYRFQNVVHFPRAPDRPESF